MEVARKIKRTKKRRHRSTTDIKQGKSLKEIKSLQDESGKVLTNLEVKNTATIIIIKKDQLIQTNDSCFQEDLENNELLVEKDEQIKSLTERLQQVTSKLYESKNAYTSLKQDFNKAQKLFCSEVGENVAVSDLLNQPGGWRGRAEQIQQLQQKVSELQLKLSDHEGSRRKTVLERRSLSNIRTYDKEKKQQIENLTNELKEREFVLENTKKKLEAAKARKAVLENDLNTSKRTLALLNEKTTHDNQLIDALHAQLKAAENKFQDRELEIRKQNEKYEREIVLLKSELEAAHLHIKNFKRQIEQKEKESEMLRSRNGVNVDRTSHQSSPVSTPRSSTKDAHEYIAIGIAAEAERERLLELVTVLNRRLDKERNDYEQLSESFRKERSRAAKIETKLQKLELERVGLPRVNTGSYRLKASKASVTSNNDLGDPEEFRLKFELLQEECLTLKTRLATMQKDKASDLATFKKMLEQTRKIFKDAYRGKLPTIGCNSSVTV